jgi:uncharacterized Tic20 family protein
MTDNEQNRELERDTKQDMNQVAGQTTQPTAKPDDAPISRLEKPTVASLSYDGEMDLDTLLRQYGHKSEEARMESEMRERKSRLGLDDVPEIPMPDTPRREDRRDDKPSSKSTLGNRNAPPNRPAPNRTAGKTYDAPYYGESIDPRDQRTGKRKNDYEYDDGGYQDSYKSKRGERYISPVSAEEKQWASLVHASAVTTFLFSLFSGGIGALLLPFIPLAVYYHQKDRSPFIARHALQAFMAQITGTLGVLGIILGVVIAGAVASVALAISIVGIILLPFLWLAIIGVIFAALLLPFAMVVFGLIGASKASQGEEYTYPYVGKWIKKTMRMF